MSIAESSVAGETPRLLYGLDEAAKLLSIGKTTLYALIRDGDIRTVRLGDRQLAPHEELQRFITGKLAERVS